MTKVSTDVPTFCVCHPLSAPPSAGVPVEFLPWGRLVQPHAAQNNLSLGHVDRPLHQVTHVGDKLYRRAPAGAIGVATESFGCVAEHLRRPIRQRGEQMPEELPLVVR